MPGVGKKSKSWSVKYAKRNQKVWSVKYAKRSLASEEPPADNPERFLSNPWQKSATRLFACLSLAWQPCPFESQNFKDVIFDSVETQNPVILPCSLLLPDMVLNHSCRHLGNRTNRGKNVNNRKWGSVCLLLITIDGVSAEAPCNCKQRQQDD